MVIVHHLHHPQADLRSAMDIACTVGREEYLAMLGDKLMQDVEG